MLTFKRRPGEVVYVGKVKIKNVDGRSVLITGEGEVSKRVNLHRCETGRLIMALRHGDLIDLGTLRIRRSLGGNGGPGLRVFTEDEPMFKLCFRACPNNIIATGIEAELDILIRRGELSQDIAEILHDKRKQGG